MATNPAQSAVAASAGLTCPQSAAPLQEAIFELSKPLKCTDDDVETEINGLGMRALDTADLHLLDQFQGYPIAIAQNLVAVLCDISLEQVHQLDIADFSMLANDAMWQVERFSVAMGLPPRFFLQPQGSAADA